MQRVGGTFLEEKLKYAGVSFPWGPCSPLLRCDFMQSSPAGLDFSYRNLS